MARKLNKKMEENVRLVHNSVVILLAIHTAHGKQPTYILTRILLVIVSVTHL
jgi:hypothetical protein